MGSYEACRRGRKATRSPSQSGYSTRSSAPSPASTSSEETEQKEEKKKSKTKQRRSRRDSKEDSRQRQKRASSASASHSRSSSKTRGKAGRTPKTKRKTRDTVNMIDETSDFSESQSSMKATRMVHLQQGQSPSSQMKVTLDTGSRFNIMEESEALSRGWKVDKLSEWQEPCLKYADGRKMPISGKATLWISLSENQNKRKVELFVTPNLNSKMIIGLIDLKRLGWTTPAWPLDIERYQTLFQTPSTDDESDNEEIVNNIDDENTPAGASSDNSEKEKDMEKTDQEDNDDDDEERPEGEICITDFEDLKTYRDIPDFKNFPTWLQHMIKEFKSVFTNQLSKHSIMNVKPATFTIKKNVEIKDNNLTAHFPPANLRESADRLLDKLEQGGLIKPAPRVTRYKSKAFFKAKKNNEARLLIDYKASQVNELLERPTHPQFSVEQVIQQVKPGNEYFLSADITGAFFCHPLQEGPEGGDLTTFLTRRGKYFFTVLPQGCRVSQDFLGTTLSEALDHKDLKDDQDKQVIRIIDDIAGCSKNLPTFKKMCKALFTRCKEFNVKLNPAKFRFSTSHINFAGVVISKEGVTPDPERMSGLSRFPRPQTCKQVKSFLGCATSLASFSSVLLQDTKHLRALTKKGAKFTWGEEEEAEMQRVITRLTDPTLLHHYDTGMPIAIDVDTSIDGVGYVAYMFDPAKGPPGPGNSKLIKCGSAAAKPTWANYSPIELEATGTLLAVRKLDHYIVNNKQVVVHNDHLPFIQSYNTKDISQISPRLRRIYLELAEHDIALTWKPAAEMVHVDSMSRNPVDPAEEMGPDPIDQQHQRLQDTINLIEEGEDDDDDADNIQMQVNDPLYSGLFKAAAAHQGYQQAIKHRLDGDNFGGD